MWYNSYRCSLERGREGGRENWIEECLKKGPRNFLKMRAVIDREMLFPLVIVNFALLFEVCRSKLEASFWHLIWWSKLVRPRACLRQNSLVFRRLQNNKKNKMTSWYCQDTIGIKRSIRQPLATKKFVNILQAEFSTQQCFQSIFPLWSSTQTLLRFKRL